MTRDLKVQCCIAGGGPAGIMLGYLLARAGVEVMVLEKWPDFFRDFRGDTIHPSTMEVLQELGLLEEFLALPHSEMTRMTLHLGGKEITVADLSHLRTACPFIAFIPQWDFLTFLSSKAKAFLSFRILMETEAVDLIVEDGRVHGVLARSKGEEFQIEADLVVGADGRHSTMREKGGFEVEELGAPIDVLWFRIGRSEEDDKQSLGYLEQGHALIMLDRHAYWQCAFIIEKGSFDSIKGAGLEAFRASIAELAHLPLAALAEVDSWDKVKLLSVTVDHARNWARDGLVLIGDAAHAMSPIGGVGINYAIQDAVASATILIPYFLNGRPPLSALTRIQERRARPTLRMQRLQVFLQNRVLEPLLRRKKPVRGAGLFRIFARVPLLERIPARIIGIGFGPEHIRPGLFQKS